MKLAKGAIATEIVSLGGALATFGRKRFLADYIKLVFAVKMRSPLRLCSHTIYYARSRLYCTDMMENLTFFFRGCFQYQTLPGRMVFEGYVTLAAIAPGALGIFPAR